MQFSLSLIRFIPFYVLYQELAV